MNGLIPYLKLRHNIKGLRGNRDRQRLNERLDCLVVNMFCYSRINLDTFHEENKKI